MNICSKIKNIMKEIANVFGTEFVKILQQKTLLRDFLPID